MSLDKNVLSENKQPLLVHLVELRSRLIKTLLCFLNLWKS